MMDSHNDIDPNEDPPVAKAPDDSSALHSWAKLHGAKHRDFSTLRRESRAPVRHRASQYESDQPLGGVTPAEIADAPVTGLPTLRSSRETDKALRTDGVERRKGVRRVEAAVMAEAASRHEGHNNAAQRQDARDAEFDLRRRRATVPQTSVHRANDAMNARKIYLESGFGALPSTQSASEADLSSELYFEEDLTHRNIPSELSPESVPDSSEPSSTADCSGPAWLYAPPTPQIPPKPLSPLSADTPPSVADTLQSSRERVASRWFALKGAFEQPEGGPMEVVRQKETRTPMLAVYSLAGGVGKTSLVATVGRCLSSMGEKVLLTDTTSHGLLPFYFGASELQHDTVRTFSPPSGSTDAPIFLVSHEMEKKGSEEAAQELFVEQLVANSQGVHRILLDLTAASSWMIGQMARMNLTVLVPVAPDMNSVISLGFVEKFFSGLLDGDARPLQPFYVLNQFDPSLPLHLDVREVLRRKLGDRLLPFVIRRAPAVSEALAEGMTVVDYAPEAPIAEDYINVATWLRSVAAPAAAGFRSVRWTEG
jgi:cellulose synthase operon protein YhjQ